MSWVLWILPTGCPPDHIWNIPGVRQQPHQQVPICLPTILVKQNSKCWGQHRGNRLPWDANFKCSVWKEKEWVCDMLGQTGAKALGNLADLSPFAADSSGKGIKLLGEPWRSTKHQYPHCSVAPCPGSVLHRSRDRQAPSESGCEGQQAQILQQGQPLDIFK